MTIPRDGEYIVWYLPYGTSAETLSRAYSAEQQNLPPYDLNEGEIVDFILTDTYEIGDPMEIRGPTTRTADGYRLPGPRLWVNTSWGID